MMMPNDDELKELVSYAVQNTAEAAHLIFFEIPLSALQPSDFTEEYGKIIAFFQYNQLKDISWDENALADPNTFIMMGKDGTSITLSNRVPSSGELRGTLLRTALSSARDKDPEKNVYEAIQEISTMPESCAYVKRTATGILMDIDKISNTPLQLASLHSMLFISTLYSIIRQDILSQDPERLKKVFAGDSPYPLGKAEFLKRAIAICNKVDLIQLYELTQSLSLTLTPSLENASVIIQSLPTLKKMQKQITAENARMIIQSLPTLQKMQEQITAENAGMIIQLLPTLQSIDQQIAKFQEKKEEQGEAAAKNFKESIITAMVAYATNNDGEAFQASCKTAIKEAYASLGKNTGCTAILKNFANVVVKICSLFKIKHYMKPPAAKIFHDLQKTVSHVVRKQAPNAADKKEEKKRQPP